VVTGPRLASRAVFAWDEHLADSVSEVGPPEGGSLLVTPGPRRRLAHASLAPSASAGGRLAARVLEGSGAARPLVALCAGGSRRIVTLTSAPLAVAARDDGGFWALHPGQIVQHDADGGAVRSVAAQAAALVPSAGDSVWAVTLDEASLLDADGREQQRLAWRGGPASAPAGGGLAMLAGGAAHVVRPDGTATSEPAGVEAHERLLAAVPDALVTAVGGGLRRRAGGLEEVPLLAAGLTGDGRPWISGRSGPSEVELRVNGDVRRLDLGAGVPDVGALRVVAVGAEALTVLGPADVWRIGEERPEHRALDDATLRESVFPVAWDLTSCVGTPTGSVLLAVSGPPGPALLELSWD
jgi:hypothetical protein